MEECFWTILVLGILDARTIFSQFCDPFRSIGLSCTLFTTLNRRGAQGNVSNERDICCSSCIILDAYRCHELLLEIFTWMKYHPCKISVYVFQKLSSWFMAQTYCAINPWLWFIFSVKYRQGLRTFFKQNILSKNVHATIPKGNMGYDQCTVPDTVAVEPTFVAFL